MFLFNSSFDNQVLTVITHRYQPSKKTKNKDALKATYLIFLHKTTKRLFIIYYSNKKLALTVSFIFLWFSHSVNSCLSGPGRLQITYPDLSIH